MSQWISRRKRFVDGRAAPDRGRCWKDRGGDKAGGYVKPKLRDSGRNHLCPLGPRLGNLFSFPAAWTPKKETWCHVQPGATPVEERGRMREEKNGTRLECAFLQQPISEVVDTMALKCPEPVLPHPSEVRGQG